MTVSDPRFTRDMTGRAATCAQGQAAARARLERCGAVEIGG